MSTAQDGVRRYANQLAYFSCCHAESLVPVAKHLLQDGPPVLTVPSATAAKLDSVTAEPVADRTFRQAGQQADLA
jgi:hypothetical protein